MHCPTWKQENLQCPAVIREEWEERESECPCGVERGCNVHFRQKLEHHFLVTGSIVL